MANVPCCCIANNLCDRCKSASLQYKTPADLCCRYIFLIYFRFFRHKDKIQCKHFIKFFSLKHYFCFPCSEETENYLLSTLPSDKYIGLAFNDENFK